jgi:hypothetical protein
VNDGMPVGSPLIVHLAHHLPVSLNISYVQACKLGARETTPVPGSETSDPEAILGRLPPELSVRITELMTTACPLNIDLDLVLRYAFLFTTVERKAQGEAVSEEHHRRSLHELSGLSRTAKWRYGGWLNIVVYGDATGEQRRTSASRTDWQIVKAFFGRHAYEFTASFQVPTSNPPVKDRVNCVNAKPRNHAGLHMLRVNVSCKHLIKDFEQVCWKTDPHGNPLAELDRSDPMRTHVSDALGYLVAREFRLRPVRGEMAGPAII